MQTMYNTLCKIAESMPEVKFEFIFVDDGSKDKTLEIIRGIASKDSKVRYISFLGTL